MNSKKLYKLLSEAVEKQLKEVVEKDVKKLEKYLIKFNATSSQLEPIFEGKKRILIPFKSADPDTYNMNDRDYQMYDYIRQVRQQGWTVDLSEPFGYAYKIVESEHNGQVFKTKRKVKLGPLISAISPYANEFWMKNNKFYTTKGNELYFARTYSIIISRVPVDILKMSDHDGWTSCHSPEGGYYKCAFQEAVDGGAIAYVVDPKSLEGIDLQAEEIFKDRDRNEDGVNPISRLRIRRFVNEKEGLEIGLPEKKVYGQNIPGFYEKLAEFLNSAQKDIIEKTLKTSEDLYDWQLMGGTYEDNQGWELFTTFFGTAKEFIGRPQPSDTKVGGYSLEEEVEEILNAAERNFKEVTIEANVYYPPDYHGGKIIFKAYATIKLPKIISEQEYSSWSDPTWNQIGENLSDELGGKIYLASVTPKQKLGITEFRIYIEPNQKDVYGYDIYALNTFVQQLYETYSGKQLKAISILKKVLSKLGLVEDEFRFLLSQANIKNLNVIRDDEDVYAVQLAIPRQRLNQIFTRERIDKALSNVPENKRQKALSFLREYFTLLARESKNWDQSYNSRVFGKNYYAQYALKVMKSCQKYLKTKSSSSAEITKGQLPLFESKFRSEYQTTQNTLVQDSGTSVFVHLSVENYPTSFDVSLEAFYYFASEKQKEFVEILKFLDHNSNKIRSDLRGIMDLMFDTAVEELYKKLGDTRISPEDEEIEPNKSEAAWGFPLSYPGMQQVMDLKPEYTRGKEFPWRGQQAKAEVDARERSGEGLRENKKLFNLDGATWRIAK